MTHNMKPGNIAPLGATVCSDGTNFCLFARHATNVELLLFDRDDAPPTATIYLDPCPNRTYHYWHVFIPGSKRGNSTAIV